MPENIGMWVVAATMAAAVLFCVTSWRSGTRNMANERDRRSAARARVARIELSVEPEPYRAPKPRFGRRNH